MFNLARVPSGRTTSDEVVAGGQVRPAPDGSGRTSLDRPGSEDGRSCAVAAVMIVAAAMPRSAFFHMRGRWGLPGGNSMKTLVRILAIVVFGSFREDGR
ncbi:hypothetical protein [Methylobacterium brachiatum]